MTETTSTETGSTLGELAKAILTRPDASPETTINNGDLLTAHNLAAMHFKANDHRAAFTIVWSKTSNNVIEIATSVVHPKDTFTKKIGTRTAIEAFLSGRTTFIPVRKYYGVKESVVDTLRFCFE